MCVCVCVWVGGDQIGVKRLDIRLLLIIEFKKLQREEGGEKKGKKKKKKKEGSDEIRKRLRMSVVLPVQVMNQLIHAVKVK